MAGVSKRCPSIKCVHVAVRSKCYRANSNVAVADSSTPHSSVHFGARNEQAGLLAWAGGLAQAGGPVRM